MIPQVTTGAGGVANSGNDSDPTKIREAAEQFEAVLIGQLLRSMRASESGGWLGTGEDAAGGSMMEIAEEHLAGVMAAQGGIGLANLVNQGIADAQKDVSRVAEAKGRAS
ncbi:MAG TPA: hypothetical protein VN428_00955 [Bryobacteraceae bacterium]|nr:hypothetical protein [Bryobacteraceae bacterium]